MAERIGDGLELFTALGGMAVELGGMATEAAEMADRAEPRRRSWLYRSVLWLLILPFRMVWHMVRAILLFGSLMAVAGVPATAAQMYWGDPTLSAWVLVLSMLFLGGLVLGLAKNAYSEMG